MADRLRNLYVKPPEELTGEEVVQLDQAFVYMDAARRLSAYYAGPFFMTYTGFAKKQVARFWYIYPIRWAIFGTWLYHLTLPMGLCLREMATEE
eukprot:CAMPEP_0115027808 /NCGR_PEP_ID=MMETSP0216-20121206/35823_1 /TAXON_ID=223996 /ORGANISM="Protocruzia adherens, Strain Boccale" /LENGTH=93 /DNA_ID=CAMNT_0002403667 /DNA_START=33 /DNA_END=311 /DNA_ORIENTATION=+